MNQVKAGEQDQHERHEKHKAFFFYVGQEIVSKIDIATGSEIKGMIIATVPSFDPTHTLVLEGHGREEDRVITDSDKVDLVVGHGREAKHFFSKPPTNFGGV